MKASKIGDFIKAIINNADLQDQDVVDAINAALDAVSAYRPRRSIAEIVADGSTLSFDLPERFYWLEALFAPSGERAQIVSVSDASYFGEARGDNFFVLYPHGKITFLKPPVGTYKLFYLEEWPHIASVDDDMPTPDFLAVAISLYGSAWKLLPEAVSAAQIRQYNTKVDSGTPDDNPVAIQVNRLLEMFNAEIKRHGIYSLRGEQ